MPIPEGAKCARERGSARLASVVNSDMRRATSRVSGPSENQVRGTETSKADSDASWARAMGERGQCLRGAIRPAGLTQVVHVTGTSLPQACRTCTRAFRALMAVIRVVPCVDSECSLVLWLRPRFPLS